MFVVVLRGERSTTARCLHPGFGSGEVEMERGKTAGQNQNTHCTVVIHLVLCNCH